MRTLSRSRGYCLTTAEILYFMPDHPSLLQSFVWQEFDLPPDFPALHRFLDFWRRELDGPLHRVRVATAPPISPPSHSPNPDRRILLH